MVPQHTHFCAFTLGAVAQHPFHFKAVLLRSGHSPRVAILMVTSSKRGYTWWLYAETVPSQHRIQMVPGPEITSKRHKVEGEGLKKIRLQSIAAAKFKPSIIRHICALFKIKKTLSQKACDISELQ